MVKRYVALAQIEVVRRIHAVASPADRLLIGPRPSTSYCVLLQSVWLPGHYSWISPAATGS